MSNLNNMGEGRKLIQHMLQKTGNRFKHIVGQKDPKIHSIQKANPNDKRGLK